MPSARSSMRLGRLTRQQAAVSALLAVHSLMLAYGTWLHSPTFNEPGHLVAGLSSWELTRFDVYRVNPPLPRMIAAIPAVVAGAETAWSKLVDVPGGRPEFVLGEDFIRVNGMHSFFYFTAARCACIPFSLLGGYLCYRWASQLYGSLEGVFALVLWCFCPSIVAHGQLVTPDIPATSLGLAASYAFWRWLRQPTWFGATVSGLVLGLAELAKLTLIIFFLAWPAMWLIYRWPELKSLDVRLWLREISMLAISMLVGIYVVNAGYVFRGSCTPLGEYTFVSQAFGDGLEKGESEAMGANRFSGTWLGTLPVPLPLDYVVGIDLQKRDLEKLSQPSYLRGQFSERGWWYYYLYAFLVKVPIGTLLLIAFSVMPRVGATTGSKLRDELILLFPAIAVLVLVSAQTGFSQHMRYTLPAFPFLFIWIGRIAGTLSKRRPVWTITVCGAVVWSIASSLWVYPHSLSYFNELVGGPTGGPRHLIHSNVDWGQDLFNLKRWLAQHPEARPLKLAYFGYFDPVHAGIDYTAPDAIGSATAIPPGWYAISVNFVRGLPYFTYKGDGTKVRLKQDDFAAFQQLEPVAMAGYSIYIYHVPESPSD